MSKIKTSLGVEPYFFSGELRAEIGTLKGQLQGQKDRLSKLEIDSKGKSQGFDSWWSFNFWQNMQKIWSKLEIQTKNFQNL